MGDIYHSSHDADFFRLNPIGSEFIYVGEPVISCLGAVTFFRVSKLTHRGPERQCNLARDRNPAKGKPLLRQGTDGNFHSGPRVHRIFTNKVTVHGLQRQFVLPQPAEL